jgi:acetyl-CoA carboxylase, biotin carboxylase subunit
MRSGIARFAADALAPSPGHHDTVCPLVKPPMFHRIMIANRGEVAVRVARACDQLGITPVFAVSEADRDAPYTRDRETVLLGPGRATHSYLDVERVVQAAVQTRCTALHPGWGFLSENPLLATMCAQHGVTFLGPPPQVMALMGGKTPAKRAMRAAGLALIPGSDGPLASAEQAREVADATGYPVLFKAESGGGGRGMRVARASSEVEAAFTDAQNEARAAFGDDRVYLEKLLEGGRHVEVQVFVDRYGNAIHLGERDCTVQRNHQKLIEESPSPWLDAALRDETCARAAAAAARIGYVGAGTMEFLLDGASATSPGVLRFMEMNTRLQVEHTVSEARSGIDLVIAQIETAAGRPLRVRQADIALRGHALECRLNAEDPAQGFRPAPGKLTAWQLPDPSAFPAGALRIDTHVEPGYEIPPHYDSLLCKVITHGDSRTEAIAHMIAALSSLRCEGVPTTIPMHLAILRSPAFAAGDYDTRRLPGWPPA